MLSGRDNKRRNAAFLGVPVGARAPGLDGVVEVESYVRDGYADSSYKADWQWRWNPVQAHRILLGLSYEYMQVDEAFMENVRPNGVRLPALPGRTPVDPEADRSLGGILLQDQWQLTSGLELTFGVRYDHYYDWGDNLSPRAAAIWRVADGHILKFQYAEAFRPPTLEESYGGALPGGSPAPDLDAETIDSQELAYIYRGNIGVFRTTLFRTHVEDLIEFVIIPGRMPALLNRGELNSYGVEFEWQQRINHTWDILANVSYVHTKDEMTDEEVVGAVDWMGNLGVTWQTLPQVEQGALLQYRGQQLGYNVRLRLPPDRTLPEYWTLNYSVAWQPLTQYPGFKVSGTVKNVFDEEYAVVSAGPTYPLGLPQLGRTWWAELSYQF
ncbi:MAG: TonB-dependent receptor [Pseudomonadales bacterium]|nr:TonB-dependent receptor [Pseudomonadales bacterium]